MVSLQRIQNQALIRLWDLLFREAPLVRQVHLDGHRLRMQTGYFRVQFEVYRLGGLDTDDELVARDVLEDALRHVLVLDAHFDLCLVKSCCYM